MKQFIIRLFTGRPRKGEPVEYGKMKIKSTSVPYNVSFDIWQEAVSKHGYDMVIKFFQKLYK